MLQEVITNEAIKERKIISVSSKRQLTIPLKYYELLGFDNEAECILQNDGLFVRPLQTSGGTEFSEQILADLISQGYEGKDLFEAFKLHSKSIQSAVKQMVHETDEFAKSGKGQKSLDEVFGLE